MIAMTVHAVVTGLQGLGAILGALVSIGAFIHFVVIRPLRHFLRNEVVANLVEIRDNLKDVEHRLVDHVENHPHTSHR